MDFIGFAEYLLTQWPALVIIGGASVVYGITFAPWR